MHGHHAFFRQQIIQHREHGLLDFTRILRAADEDEAICEIDGNHSLALRPMSRRVCLEGWQIDNGKARREISFRWRDQEMLDEQGVPCVFADHAGWQFMQGIGAANQILNEQLPVAGLHQKVTLQGLELRAAHGLGVVPPDGVFRCRITHEEFVVGAAAGVRAG